MKNLKIGLTAIALFASVGFANAQQGFFGPNLPIVGGASYCGSYVNNVCQLTIPAGPTTLTGSESIPANTNLSQGRNPQQVLITPAALGALPISFVTVTTPPAGISASNLNGGVVYSSTATITSANITLPASAQQGQTYSIGSNRTITTLSVVAATGDSIDSNSSPTVLTASTTGSDGYKFICDKTSGVCVWKRLL